MQASPARCLAKACLASCFSSSDSAEVKRASAEIARIHHCIFRRTRGESGKMKLKDDDKDASQYSRGAVLSFELRTRFKLTRCMPGSIAEGFLRETVLARSLQRPRARTRLLVSHIQEGLPVLLPRLCSQSLCGACSPAAQYPQL